MMKFIFNIIISLVLTINCIEVVAQKPQGKVDSLSDAKTPENGFVKFDDTRDVNWSKDFKLVTIKSSGDSTIQRAYFFRSTGLKPRPLIISLHTWSGSYSQKDEVAEICRQKNLNYIHPDFRGPNNNPAACCSELAINDIDDAIAYAIKYANVDTTKIYVIGVSGGGYATLSTFMKSGYNIRKFSAWASIADLTAWYHESTILKNKYAKDIFNCTNSKDELNNKIAISRSPLFMTTPLEKRNNAEVFIYAGIYDGIQGSVPITHSINFYNKLLTDFSIKDSSKYVSMYEKLQLLESRRPLGDFGLIANRKICLIKQSGNIRLTIFEGDHEMLTEFAINELLKD